jgi:hypothetical protein
VPASGSGAVFIGTKIVPDDGALRKMDITNRASQIVTIVVGGFVIYEFGEKRNWWPVSAGGDWQSYALLGCVAAMVVVNSYLLWSRRRNRNTPPSKLKIHSASWGSDTHRRPVLEAVNRQPKDALVLTVSNEVLECDPAWGNDNKYIEVEYSYGDGPLEKVIRMQGRLLILPEDKRFIEDTAKDYDLQIQALRGQLGELKRSISVPDKETWDAINSRLEIVKGQQFVFGEVILDGKRFVECSFESVGLIYNGTAPCAMEATCRFDDFTLGHLGTKNPSLAQWAEIGRATGLMAQGTAAVINGVKLPPKPAPRTLAASAGSKIEVTRHVVTKDMANCQEIGDLLRVYNDGPSLVSNIRFGPVKWKTFGANQHTLHEHPITLLPALSPLPSKESQETRLFVGGIGTMHFYQCMRSNIPNDAVVTVEVTYESDGSNFSREFTLNSQPDKDHTIIWRGGPVKQVGPFADAASGAR